MGKPEGRAKQGRGKARLSGKGASARRWPGAQGDGRLGRVLAGWAKAGKGAGNLGACAWPGPTPDDARTMKADPVRTSGKVTYKPDGQGSTGKYWLAGKGQSKRVSLKILLAGCRGLLGAGWRLTWPQGKARSARSNVKVKCRWVVICFGWLALARHDDDGPKKKARKVKARTSPEGRRRTTTTTWLGWRLGLGE